MCQLSSPGSLISRLATVNAIFLRGVDVERAVMTGNEAVLRYRGFEKSHRLMEPIILGFFRGMLEINGAKDLRARFTRPIGSPEYAELVVTWR